MSYTLWSIRFMLHWIASTTANGVAAVSRLSLRAAGRPRGWEDTLAEKSQVTAILPEPLHASHTKTCLSAPTPLHQP